MVRCANAKPLPHRRPHEPLAPHLACDSVRPDRELLDETLGRNEPMPNYFIEETCLYIVNAKNPKQAEKIFLDSVRPMKKPVEFVEVSEREVYRTKGE